MTLFLAQSPEGVLDQSGQLIRRTIDGFVQGRSLVSDRDGLTAFESGFHHTAHGVIAGLLVAVLVAQMDIHSRDVFAESLQGTLYYATDSSGQRLVSIYVAVGMNFDLHGISLSECCPSYKSSSAFARVKLTPSHSPLDAPLSVLLRLAVPSMRRPLSRPCA